MLEIGPLPVGSVTGQADISAMKSIHDLRPTALRAKPGSAGEGSFIPVPHVGSRESFPDNETPKLRPEATQPLSTGGARRAGPQAGPKALSWALEGGQSWYRGEGGAGLASQAIPHPPIWCYIQETSL